MKNFISNLFGKPPFENQQVTGSEQIPLYSPDHPAHEEIRKIEELAEKTIKVKVCGNSAMFSHNSEDYFQMVELFDKAVAKVPNDADLLYARASLHYFGMQGKDGQDDRTRVLIMSPSHFDATMCKEHFKSWDSLFRLSAFDQSKTPVSPIITDDIERGRYAQVVRDHLRGAVAIILPENPNINLAGTKIRWELKWINTPNGNVAAHYIFFSNGKFQEMFIPHLTENEPKINSNYWLLRRLALEKYCLIGIVRGSKVIWSQRFVFSPSQLKTLQQLGADLKKDGPVSSMDKFQTASQWYMNNSDEGALKY